MAATSQAINKATELFIDSQEQNSAMKLRISNLEKNLNRQFQKTNKISNSIKNKNKNKQKNVNGSRPPLFSHP